MISKELKLSIISEIQKFWSCTSDRILIVPDRMQESVSEGIMLAETARGRDETQTGTVICTGSGKVLESGQFIPTSIKVGMRVIYKRHAGDDLYFDEHGKETNREILQEDKSLAVRCLVEDAIILYSNPE